MNRLVEFFKLESIFGKTKSKERQSIDPELDEQFTASFRYLKEDDIPLDSDELTDKAESSNKEQV